MAILNLAQASAIIDAALAEEGKRSFAPLAVAVLDSGGVNTAGSFLASAGHRAEATVLMRTGKWKHFSRRECGPGVN